MSEIETKIAVFEERLRNMAAASGTLHDASSKEIATVRGIVLEIQKDLPTLATDGELGQLREWISKLEAKVAKLEAKVEHLERTPDHREITGRFAVAPITGQHAIQPAPRRRRSSDRGDRGGGNALVEITKVWGPIVASLIALIGTLVAFLTQHL